MDFDLLRFVTFDSLQASRIKKTAWRYKRYYYKGLGTFWKNPCICKNNLRLHHAKRKSDMKTSSLFCFVCFLEIGNSRFSKRPRVLSSGLYVSVLSLNITSDSKRSIFYIYLYYSTFYFSQSALRTLLHPPACHFINAPYSYKVKACVCCKFI